MQTSKVNESHIADKGLQGDGELPLALDFSHHISELAKARKPFPIKTVFKYYGRPGLLAMAGGLPHPQYFPFETLQTSLLRADAFFAIDALEESPLDVPIRNGPPTDPKMVDPEKLTVPKWPVQLTEDINLARALQYDMAKGLGPLQQYLHDYSKRFFKPAYRDFTTLVHTGNTDGWSRVIMTLLNPGDGLLMEEWTFTAPITAVQPLGIQIVPVPMDSQGFNPEALDEILANWDEKERGCKRPRLLYTNPIGQNPCGVTVGRERKKQIYDLAVKYDFIICEDDPYYYLQEGKYVSANERQVMEPSVGVDVFFEELEPSYLSFDSTGHVIRMDTFSKTLGPGLRLGWYTCNPIIAERLERHGEISSQAPAGLSQAIVTQLLVNQWGLEGWVTWLRGLRAQYSARRDALVDALLAEIDFKVVDGEGMFAGSVMYRATFRSTGGGDGNDAEDAKPGLTVRFIPPTAGMFCWIQVQFHNLPDPIAMPGLDEAAANHEGHLWEKLADGGLLVLPGWMFCASKEVLVTEHPNKIAYYRISYSDPTREDMRKAAKVLSRVLQEYCDIYGPPQ
ncbi:hypothetical protein FRC17_001750 [Serendipita sp. 399]|nr:hypothetical protein FRC17_001750 [Serendipita sp. 399]